MNWTTPNDIRMQLQRLWDDQSLLRDVVGDLAAEIVPPSPEPPQLPTRELQVSFPLMLRLRKPTPRELADSYEQVKAWVKALEAGSRSAIGHGYHISWEETNHRLVGRNASPIAVVVPTREDALAIIGQKETAASFASLARNTLDKFPELLDWLKKKPLKVVEEAPHWNQVLAVTAWLRAQPRSGRYVRQIDVAEVDTKFIERRKALISELLDVVLPAETIDPGHSGPSGFEARYGLSSKPAQVRFRILDDALAIAGLTDLTVRADEFARLNIGAERVFVVENEINGLAFPPVERGLVIFRLGYAVELIAGARWIGRRNLHYWGDIDTHGFAILDRLRGAFPHAKSLLMDRTTLVANKSVWTQETAQYVAPLQHLTLSELSLFDDLRFDRLGRGVRLEQERISFGLVERAVNATYTGLPKGPIDF